MSKYSVRKKAISYVCANMLVCFSIFVFPGEEGGGPWYLISIFLAAFGPLGFFFEISLFDRRE